MKKSKKLVKTQRKSLDEKLSLFNPAKTIIRPKSGWIQAIRESLGMTTTQLAERMGIQQSGVSILEKREAAKVVSLETLERAARALNCRLIYALVPEETLEKTVDDQALVAAKKYLQKTLHTMALESQTADQNLTSMHLQELQTEIKNKLDRRLWEKK